MTMHFMRKPPESIWRNYNKYILFFSVPQWISREKAHPFLAFLSL